MYKEYNINLLYKFIGLLLFILTIIFIENVYVLTILFFMIFFLNKKNSPILILMSVITFFFLFFKYFNHEVGIVNIMLAIDYIIIFIFHINKEELLTLKNVILNKKFTYKDLSSVYFDEINNNNYEIFDKYVSRNKLEDNDDLLEIKERLIDKSRSDVYEKVVTNYIRFYKNQNDYHKKLAMNKETIIYLGIHLLFLIIAMVI